MAKLGSGPLVVLCVLDGFGVAGEPGRDPRTPDTMPTWFELTGSWPTSRLQASGEAVGLPAGQMGNSEVGHLNLGAGFPVLQDLPRINQAIADGSFFQNAALAAAVSQARNAGSSLHLMALIGPGGVHAIDDHLLATVELAARGGLPPERVWLHLFTDGRDTPPMSAAAYVRALELGVAGKARPATVSGRFWAMDRDQRWERTARAAEAIVAARGPAAGSAGEAIEAAYAAGTGDEFIEPTVLDGYSGIRPRDALVHLNFRADRARQLCQMLAAPAFDAAPRLWLPERVSLTTLTECQDPAELPVPVAFPPTVVPSLAGHLADLDLRQLHVAETEKYAHVTYFFNGGREEPFAGEERVLVPSRRDVPTYDLAPEMSAEPITDVVVEALTNRRFDFVLVNYANADMVGHTGDWDASVAAVAVLDRCLDRLVQATLAVGACLLVTGDHGNIEQMRDERGDRQTKHTTSDVPLLAVGESVRGASLAAGLLADVAPTVCRLLAIPAAPTMTGHDLLADPAILAEVG